MKGTVAGWLMLVGLGAVLLNAAPVSGQESTTGAVRVDTVLVRGNQRISEAAVRTGSGLQPRTNISAADVQQAIRRLMSTGNFSTVQVLGEGEPGRRFALVIDLEERPLIASYNFRGLARVSPKTVRDTLKLEDNRALDPDVVIRTESMIRNLLARQGVQVQSIDTTLTPVPGRAGAYQLTFNVREGNRLAIADIEFRGNQAFSDAALRGSMDTKREGFLWFRQGRFDQETFRTDLQKRLPDFYAGRGYIDFTVVSDTLIIDPESGKARLQIAVAEGPQYRLGEFNVEGNSRFPSDQLARYFTAESRSVLGLPFGRAGERERGEVFDRVALNSATQQVQQLYRNEGYLYAQVEPVLRRVPAAGPQEQPRVDVTWAISERQPFYIRNVAIVGNQTTHESVIRDRLVVFPGDVYNEERLIQSYQSIGALGFFETPMPTPDIVPNAESGEVDITFHIKEKQTGNINFGTSIGGGYAGSGGGISGFLGFTQPNLFGQGKQASVRAEYGPRRNTFEASYTDPALFGSRNSGSASLFRTEDRFLPFGGGRYLRTGASLQYGFPLANFRWSRGFLGYSLSRQSYAANEEDCVPGESIFCVPDATASTLSLGTTRDTRNHPMFATSGTRQAVSLAQTGGPLGGDGNFQRATTELQWWVPVGQIGGGQPGQRPIRTTVGLQARTGTVFGELSRFPFQRFYLGGTTSGESLRGYEESTITPFGYVPRNASFPSTGRLGNAFLVLSSEFAVRINDNLSVSVFGDAGNVWSQARYIDPTRLFRGAGIGATVVTPFGPIGLDYAYGFDKTQPGWQFHFKFGQGF